MNLEINNVKKYFDEFGEKLIQDIVEKINKERWVKSGNLINSLNFSSKNEGGFKLLGELEIADYYAFLNASRRQSSGLTTKRVTSTTKRVNVTTKRLATTTQNLRETWVTPIINNNIENFKKVIENEIDKEINKKIKIDYK